MRGLKKRKSLVGKSAFLRIFLLLAISIASIQLFQNSVKADQLSWTSENPTYSDSGSSIPTSDLDAKNCINQQALVSPDAQPTQICVYQKDNFRYGYYQKTHNSGMWNAYTENKLVVGIGSDSNMYKVENVSYSPMPLDLSVEGDLLYKHGCAGCPWGGDLYIYKDFIRNLHREFSFTTGTTYTYDDSKIKILRYLDNNQPLRVNRVDASDNGRWLVMEIIGRGIVRLDRETMAMKQISGYTGRYGVGLDPRMEMAISDDGNHIAIAGHNTTFITYDVNNDCGGGVDSTMTNEMTSPCPGRELSSTMNSHYPNGYFSVHKPSFSDGGVELSFYIKEEQASQNVKRASLVAAGHQLKKLDYLALGDSYSSGEGDTATTSSGQKYYLANTDADGDYANGVPREKCHQSTRAWPFLLADNYNIPVADKFETVACSGAKIGDIASQNNKYEGQRDGGKNNSPRLSNYTNIIDMQSDALEEFIPGRVRQIEFLEKTKPKAVTIGISGNDVNFGSIILSCTQGSIGSTCDYASNNKSKAQLGSSISTQYDHLVTLFQRVHKASPLTKIYAIGYPKFVSTGHSCGLNVHLNDQEREMAERAVEYLNDIIQKAAKRSGVSYIKLEDSLNGKRLCDTTKPYVTGIALSGKSEKQESFHPNMQGNQKIADSILEQFDVDTMLTYSQNCPIPYSIGTVVCPDVNVETPSVHPYFASAMESYTEKTKQIDMTSQIVTKNTPQSQKVDPFTLKPNSTVSRELHSSPVDLGEAVVAEDGSLDAIFTIPENVPAGYHTLNLIGESYSGEQINLTQIIEVQGPDADIDEDSIDDDIDECMYIQSSNVDTDYDAIDDACDPEISEVSPYRVRNGESQKNENPDYMYVERNTTAASVTGISGDHDSDNDGWAIVAQSTKPQNAGEPAHFWIDDDKVPHVSTRTSDRGCAQFTPNSLKVVKPNKIRKLKQETKNTNTCRSESAEADTDSDGTPDNQQILYRARNGNISNNEDPSYIYIERSTVAAEAQLGLSDYPHYSPWNILATSHNDTTKASFVKLVMVTDQNNKPLPTILANQTKTNTRGKITITCIALQPQNTNTITTNNQDRKLKKVPLPSSHSC